MSITGYGPAGGTIRVMSSVGNDVHLEIPRESVVKNVTLSRFSERHWLEMAAPFIIHHQQEKVKFQISTTPFRKYLPNKLDDSKITLLFFQKRMRYVDDDGEVAYGEEEECNDWKIKRPLAKSLEIEGDLLTGTYYFSIEDFRTTMNRSLLYMGLTIHNLRLQYLIEDIAVFTNTSQLVGNRPAVGKEMLRPAFWWSEDIFVEKKKQPSKKRKDSDEEFVEELSSSEVESMHASDDDEEEGTKNG